MLTAAANRFQAQYDQYDAEFSIKRYDYLDEQTRLADKYGTPEVADIFFAGSWNVPLYVKRGWLVPLDDLIGEERAPTSMNPSGDKTPLTARSTPCLSTSFQNTLMVNRAMMQSAGLEEYIPQDDSVAHWSIEEFNLICQKLKDTMNNENTFAFMMYAANNQGRQPYHDPVCVPMVARSMMKTEILPSIHRRESGP